MAPDSVARNGSLWVIRHSPSVSNEERRIQGQLDQPGLSVTGRDHARSRAAAWRFGSPSSVWSSDLRRASETADHLVATSGAGLRLSPLLREVGAGCLEGCTHAAASRDHPNSYAAWMARGDLDQIPGAESGDAVQARAIAFLLTAAAGPHEESMLVVTHAAFMRSLVNTARQRPRNESIDVGHDAVHRLDAPWLRQLPMPSQQSWASQVVRVDTADGPYVVKSDHKDATSSAVAAIADEFAADVGSPATLARADPVLGGAGVRIERFVDGVHVLVPLSEREWPLLLDLFERLGRAADRLSSPARLDQLPTMLNVLEALDAGNQAGQRLQDMLNDRRTRSLAGARDRVVDLDVHRENILVSDSAMTRVDFDFLCAGPESATTACQIACGVLLYESADVRELICRLNPTGLSADRYDEILLLIRLRLEFGRAYFEARGREPAAILRLQWYTDAIRRLERATSAD